MTQSIKEKAVADMIMAKNNILLISHRRTDGDTCGSCAALCLAIRKTHRNCYILRNTETSYRNKLILEQFVAPDNFNPQLIISVDVADLNLLSPEAERYADMIDICIDHHASNCGYAKNTFLEPNAAATGELILKVIDCMGIQLDERMGEFIYIALSTDTGCFKYSSTTAQTMIAASRCYASGANIAPINKRYFDTKSLKRIQLENYIYENLQFFHQKEMVLVVIYKKFLTELCATSDDMDSLSALPSQIEGVKLAITITENRNGGFRLSARSSGEVNCSQFCEYLGGGGHKNASGAYFKDGEADEIVARVIAVSNNFFPQDVQNNN